MRERERYIQQYVTTPLLVGRDLGEHVRPESKAVPLTYDTGLIHSVAMWSVLWT
jgi:hypothetical protein